MTQASPLLAYLQSMQQGRQQSEQMRQQFALQNLEQGKSNAQFLMELADKQEARNQQRKQFEWQQNEENRRTLAEGQAIADRVSKLQADKDARESAIANYIAAKANPLSAAHKNVIAARKSVEELAKNGDRFLPSQAKQIRSELAKAESLYAAEKQGFDNSITGDTAYGIDWSKVGEKYTLPTWTMPAGLMRRGMVPPTNLGGGGVDGKGPLKVDTNTTLPAGVNTVTPEPEFNVGMSPIDNVFPGTILPMGSMLGNNFVGIGAPNVGGIGAPPKPAAAPAKPVKPVDLIGPLTALRGEHAKQIEGGEWQTHELDSDKAKVIRDLVEQYFKERGESFRPKTFDDTHIGSDIFNVLHGYRGHVGDVNAIRRFISDNMYGDISEFSPNVIGGIASRLTDEGYMDPSVLKRLSEEASKARTERGKELEQKNAQASATREAEKHTHAKSLWQFEKEEARLKNVKLNKEINDVGKSTGKDTDPELRLSRAYGAWAKAAGDQEHLKLTLKDIDSQLTALGTNVEKNTAKKLRRDQLTNAKQALLNYMSNTNTSAQRDTFTTALLKGDIAKATKHSNSAMDKWTALRKAYPTLDEFYGKALKTTITGGATAGDTVGGTD